MDKVTKKRTLSQAAAIEVYCRELAAALNDAGYDQKAVLENKQIAVPNTQDSIKHHIFKPIMAAICYDDKGEPKISTTQLETKEVNEVYEVCNRFSAATFGISVPFPSLEEELNESRVK